MTAIELFANQASTTVSSGGTGAPVGGTQETWTVASSSEFPAASNSAVPPTQFHIADLNFQGEIIAVTNVSGSTWTVTRGAESTIPTTHAAGFTIYQVATAAGLGGMLQSGNNLSDLASVSAAQANLNVTQGLKFLTGGGTISASTITAAQSAGFQGIFLDPRYVWSAGGLVIKDISNFIIESRMAGSIGFSGNIAYNTGGYVSTGSSSADGIQVYSDGTNPTQGIMFRNLAIVGSNSYAVVHFGGRQRRCAMEDCFVLNTGNVSTTIAAGSNGGSIANIASWSSPSAGTLDVASSASFPSAGGTVLIATSNGVAAVTYTGTGTGTLTGCTLNSSASAGTVATGGAVQLTSFAVVDDTALNGANSEDQSFLRCDFASSGSGGVLGIDISNISQHANDTLWSDIATASSGMVSLAALGGGGHNFLNYYDRSTSSGATVATVWNSGSTLVFRGGEDQNNASTGVAHLLDNSSANTVIDSRNLTQSATGNATLASVLAGTLTLLGRCKFNGTAPALAISGGTADMSAASVNVAATAPLAITGSSGKLLLVSDYSSGTSPGVSGWTGTTVYPWTGLMTAYRQNASLAPSATSGTFGSVVTLSADAGYSGFMLFITNIVTTGVGSETVTLQSVVTYSDNSTNTQSALATATTNASTSLTSNQMITLLGSIDGKYVKSVAFSIKSTINSSGASMAVNTIGLSLP